MRIKNIVFRIIISTVLSIYLSSCASSSYTEKYGRNTTDKKNSKIEITSSNKVEDEISIESSKVDSNEVEEIIEQLEDVIGTNKKKENFLRELLSFLNTPYRYGGNSKEGIDCSAFTQNVYQNSLSISIPRTAREQYKRWKIFKSKDDLKFGDLVYFDTSNRYFPGHVGIYLDDDLFAHASSSKGVIVSSMKNIYFINRYVGANRIKIKIQK